MPMRTTMAPGAGSSMRAGAASLGERGPPGPRAGSSRVSSRRPAPGSPAAARGCRSGGGGGSGGGDSGLSCLLPAGLRGMLRAARRGGRHRHRGPCGRQAVSAAGGDREGTPGGTSHPPTTHGPSSRAHPTSAKGPRGFPDRDPRGDPVTKHGHPMRGPPPTLHRESHLEALPGEPTPSMQESCGDTPSNNPCVRDLAEVPQAPHRHPLGDLLKNTCTGETPTHHSAILQTRPHRGSSIAGTSWGHPPT